MPDKKSIEEALKVFGLADQSETVTLKDVKQKYHALVLKTHPDKVERNGESDELFEEKIKAATEEFKKLGNAYELLNKHFNPNIPTSSTDQQTPPTTKMSTGFSERFRNAQAERGRNLATNVEFASWSSDELKKVFHDAHGLSIK